MKESEFQSKLIKKLKAMFPGIEIMKQDAQYRQGQPDLVLFYHSRYAMLECKKSSTAHHQPNQDYYVDKFNNWSFASFIFPENEQEVLSQLQTFFQGG